VSGKELPPLTGSGKIQKFVLRERFVAGEFEPA
jgi:hypothetical protein